MRRCGLWLMLIVLGLGGVAGASEDAPTLQRPEAERLLREAAAISPAYMRTLMALDPKTLKNTLHAARADVPLTALIIGLAHGKQLDTADLAWLEHATPRTFTAVIHPLEGGPGGLTPKHATANVLHPELVRNVGFVQHGDRARGTIEFGKQKIFKGVVQWRAAWTKAAGWQIVELIFERSHAHLRRDGARWALSMARVRSQVNPRRGADLDLPRVGTVGQEPPKGMELLITVTRDGYIHLGTDATKLSLDELSTRLEAENKRRNQFEPDGASGLAALIDADAGTPWVLTQWLMQICAHPAIKIYKLYFGARAKRDDSEGCLTAFLPKDRSGPLHPGGADQPLRVKAKVFRKTGGEASDVRALYAALLKIPLKKRREAVYEIVAPPPHGGRVQHGYILSIMDAMLAAGAQDIIFEGAAMPRDPKIHGDPEGLARYLAAKRAEPGPAYIKIGTTRLGKEQPTRDIPSVGRVERVLGGPSWGAGYGSRAFDLLEEEVEVLEEVEEVDAPPTAELRLTGQQISIDRKSRHKPPGKRPALERAREAAALQALGWLAAHQSKDGGWEAVGWAGWQDGARVPDAAALHDGQGKPKYSVGVTGLALSAFLAAGFTNRGKHPFAKVVGKGLRYLKNVQDPEGCFGRRDNQRYVYQHAMAAQAMLRAYMATGSPIFKGSAQRALDFCALTRNPYFAWRYGVKPGDNDTSVTAWMLQPVLLGETLNAAARARNKPEPLTIDGSTFDGVRAWLHKMGDPSSGRFGYVQRGMSSSRPLNRVKAFPVERVEGTTAAAVYALLRVGPDAKLAKMMPRSLARLRAKPPRWNKATGDIDMIYWYWGMLAAHAAQARDKGKLWKLWQAEAVNAMLASQRKDGTHGALKGSWDPVGAWGGEGGRVYATAILTLACLAHFDLAP